MGIDFSAPSSLDASPLVLPSSASSPRPSRRGVFSVATVISLRGTFDKLLRHVHVRLCADRCDIVEDDRLAEARGFCQAHVAWHHVLENLGAEVLSGVLG